MLSELHLNNFRCFGQHVLPLRPTTVIVGANNAGKSTVIEALRIISVVVARYQSLAFHEVPAWLSLPRVYRGMSPSLRGIDFNSLSVFHALGDPPAVITATFRNGMSVEAYVGSDAEIYAVVREADGKVVGTKSRALSVSIPDVSILPQIAPVAKEEVILERDYARRVTSSNWASLHFRNQLNLYPQYWDDFVELSESTWPGLRILRLEGKGGMTRDPLALLLQDGSFVAEVGWMGHGLQMWLQTM